MVLLAVDLAVANARLIWTVPQAEFDAPSEAARQIEAAERLDPSPGPFRIHRMTGSYPSPFLHRRDGRSLPRVIAGRAGHCVRYMPCRWDLRLLRDGRAPGAR